ncbi:G-protein coupled receptor Mth2-like [Prorops nasuta]|uniref:G-protein coupled receptor Mth2-like n=1 Tax=Prorops nasuta TaxID=863751 RepID=UPI0034CE0B01
MLAKLAITLTAWILTISTVMANNNRSPYETSSFIKCCKDGSILYYDLACTSYADDTKTIFHVLNVTGDAVVNHTTCFMDADGGYLSAPINNTLTHRPENWCLDVLPDGTAVGLKISLVAGNGSAVTCKALRPDRCDSVFTPLKYWGASIVIFANIIYIIPYVLVVSCYVILPDLRKRAYNKAVACYNLAQLVQNAIMIDLGRSILCYKRISRLKFFVTGTLMMYLTVSSTLWLFIICFDMTLVITRFRWVAKGDNNRDQEFRKILMYSCVCWGLPLIPSLLVVVLDLVPWLPENSPYRPNIHNFYNPNTAFYIYFTVIPIIVCLTDTVLFIFTSWKLYQAKRANALALNNNASKKKTKNYLVFFKLYLLMDSAYISGAVGAAFPNLWIVKFFRMIQPILMLMAIIPRRTFINAFKRKKRRSNSRQKRTSATVLKPTVDL